MQVYPRVLEASRAEGPPQSSMVEEALSEAHTELDGRARDLEDLLGSRPEVKLVADAGIDGTDGIGRTILGEAGETDATVLIPVGNRGLGRIHRVWIGSVSTKVVRAADGPSLPASPRYLAGTRRRAVARPGRLVYDSAVLVRPRATPKARA
ncbi:MAG: universal stress protein [Actinomycetota bacterium]|nr:universal stress protein [Actinomycetota bacterium]